MRKGAPRECPVGGAEATHTLWPAVTRAAVPGRQATGGDVERKPGESDSYRTTVRRCTTRSAGVRATSKYMPLGTSLTPTRIV